MLRVKLNNLTHLYCTWEVALELGADVEHPLIVNDN